MKLRLLAIVVVALCVLAVFARIRNSGHKSTVKTFFNDAQGLQAGATVRVAGVDVGRVTSVRVRDDLHDKPAEVIMSLQTSYELKIPSDSIVELRTEGVLGQTYPEILIRNASGAPLPENGTLRSQESSQPSPGDLLECFAGIVRHEGCNLQKPATPPPQ